jgi:transcription elongation GreA/GreB family factor
MTNFKELKTQIYNKCVEFADQRINNIQCALATAIESGNDETKSSAGDKHETGRAMMQLEQENNLAQLLEALELKKNISKIDPNQLSATVKLGSLIITNKGVFYISISAGKIKLGDVVYYAVSPVSPIASKLIGMSANQEIDFNGQLFKIISIA